MTDEELLIRMATNVANMRTMRAKVTGLNFQAQIAISLQDEDKWHSLLDEVILNAMELEEIAAEFKSLEGELSKRPHLESTSTMLKIREFLSNV